MASSQPSKSVPQINNFAFLDRSGTFVVAGFALLAAAISLWYFYSHGWANIYGDGISRLNGTRKLLDWDYPDLWSRYLQIGTPWLPLPYFVMAPFVSIERLWRTGLAGSIVSGISFIITAIIVYKHSGLIYRSERNRYLFGLVSTLVFVLNPSMLYMQTTPMTESLFICTLASSIYFLQKWAFNYQLKTLLASAVCLGLAELTRYEAWSLAPFAGLVVLLLSNRVGWRKAIDGAIWGSIVAAVWIYWFWHNWAISGNALEFYNGYYSAKMIYARQNVHPITTHSLLWTSIEGLGAVLSCAGVVATILSITGLG